MKIVDLLSKDSIQPGGKPKSKAEAVDMLVDLQVRGGKITDRETYKRDILEREDKSSTAAGEGIAIPHAKSKAVKAPSLAAMTVPEGVDYDAPDDEPSNLFFMIAAPDDGDVHLEVLSRLMTLLMDENFREKLLRAENSDEFIEIIDRMEKEKYPEKSEVSSKTEPVSDTVFRVLCVTACPTGIAHTYMAAEALEKAGKNMGITVKAETNGSGGAKNILTKKEIEACDGIIVAADKTVEMARFDGKKVIITKVSDGISIPEKLIRRIADGDAPVYHHSGVKTADISSSGESFGRKIYRHLMNGVSNMLPFTVSGGIFIAVAFLIDTITGAPHDSGFGSYNPAAAFLKSTGGYAFSFMVPVLAGYIGKSIADRPGFLTGFAGGYLASVGSTFASVGGDIPSGFLGGLFAGFAGGYLMLAVRKLCEKMPKALDGIRPVLIYPLAGLGLISVVMCAVNPAMGWLNTAVAGFLNSMGGSSKVLLGCVLGGMMAIDMGGPFNKAAYVFGTMAVASGSYDIMAAVMIGGMVPPVATALAAAFFKNKFTEEERKNSPVTCIMGLSFITEGAIPYAAADPLRVIPACIAGSAAAGGLSMLFNCTLMAPHGGIFVFAVAGNWPLYCVSLLAGSAVGMLLLGLLKKNITDK